MNLYKRKRLGYPTHLLDNCENEEDMHNIVTRKGNDINFHSDVTRRSIFKLIEYIKEVDDELSDIEQHYRSEEPMNYNIYIHINSNGGDVFSTLSVIDVILQTKHPCISVIEGTAASAATIISIVCAKRYINKHSQMLIHQLSSGFLGKFNEITDEYNNLEKLMTMLTNIYKKHSKLKKNKDLNRMLNHDIWLSSTEALKYGLADEIRNNKYRKNKKRKLTKLNI